MNGIEEQNIVNQQLIKLSRETGIPLLPPMTPIILEERMPVPMKSFFAYKRERVSMTKTE